MSLKLTLINKIKRFNPKWANDIFDFLSCRSEYLTSSDTDHSDADYDEAEYLELDMNRTNKCVVGEIYNFTYESDRCKMCEHFSMQLFHNNDGDHRDVFQDELEQLYHHVEYAHPELIK